MAQNLLAERFHLAVHKEQQPVAAYALEVGKGLKAQPSEPAPLSEQRCVPGTGAAGQKHIICRHLTMALLAENLPEIASKALDIPVVDQTGIAGTFDLQLDWTSARAASAGPTDDVAGPTLFEALDAQLGLKLKRTRLPQPVIMVDRVERMPVEN